MAIQVSVSGPDEDGRREIAIHSRPDGEEEEWAQNAERHPLRGTAHRPPSRSMPGPPRAPSRSRSTTSMTVLAEHGPRVRPRLPGPDRRLERGRAASTPRSPCPRSRAEEAHRFGIHPALLDAALHGVRLAAIEAQGQGPSLPSSWRGVSLHGGRGQGAAGEDRPQPRARASRSSSQTRPAPRSPRSRSCAPPARPRAAAERRQSAGGPARPRLDRGPPCRAGRSAPRGRALALRDRGRCPDPPRPPAKPPKRPGGDPAMARR